MEPTGSSERILVLDVLRGLAVGGVFVVNMTLDLPGAGIFSEQPLGTLDKATSVFVDTFANGKFITLFSFMFGLSFLIQSERLRKRDAPFIKISVRRLLSLFLIGLIAEVLGIGGGEILMLYAVFGFPLLAFENRRLRTILIAAGVCFVIQYLGGPVRWELIDAGYIGDTAAGQVDPEAEQEANIAAAQRVELFRNGGIADFMSYRARTILRYYTSFGYFVGDLDLLALMFLGVYVGRRAVFQNVAGNLGFVRRVLRWTLVIGVVGTVIRLASSHFVPAASDSLMAALLIHFFDWTIGAKALGLCYAAILVLYIHRKRWTGIQKPLSALGRAALTNYLLQGTVIAFLSYSYGLGLYGRVPPSTGLLLVFLLLPAQAWLSMWWLSRYRFGPLEYVWRTMTYGRLPLLRT